MFADKTFGQLFPVFFKILMVIVFVTSSVLTVTPAHAAGIIVNTTDDELNSDGDCSLREAITAANTDAAVDACAAGFDADTIAVPAGIYTLTITGTSEDANATGDLDIAGDLTINGAGRDTTVIQAGATPGSGLDRVFDITGAYTVSISDITIANGACASCDGGGIFTDYSSILKVKNSTLSNNSATFGGGISNSGSLSLTNSTISTNSAGVSGGGIYNSFDTLSVTDSTLSGNSAQNGGGIVNHGTLSVTKSTLSGNSAISGGGINNAGPLTVTNSTFSGNSATDRGGGIYANGGSLAATNSTFSGNSAADQGGGIFNIGIMHLKNTILANSTSTSDCSNAGGDTIATDINNLIETNGPSGSRCGVPALSADPSLGTLTGTPAYFPLHAGSPAIGAGNNATCAAEDQRGIPRPQGTNCDIGAYEYLQTFADVAPSHSYWLDIEILYANGLTAGCSVTPFNFCPDQIMDRAQSAVFTLRGNFGISYTPPLAPWDRFADDWSPGAWAEKWAEGMWNAGFTAGCATSPLRYCPWDQTPRVQAAVFGLRLKYGNSYVPPAASGTVFFDMTNTAYYGTKWAEQAYADGLLPNCGMDGGTGKPLFCPTDLVNRGLAAYMIVRAKSLTMP
jgi:CSLREA domain-containing protein